MMTEPWALSISEGENLGPGDKVAVQVVQAAGIQCLWSQVRMFSVPF